MMNYQDRTLTCVECGVPVTFSADDQAYPAEKGYTNEPRRCPSCRRARRGQRNRGGFDSGFGGDFSRDTREMHPAVCAECGKDTTVPFRPRGDRPVYCNDCFRSRRSQSTFRRF